MLMTSAGVVMWGRGPTLYEAFIDARVSRPSFVPAVSG